MRGRRGLRGRACHPATGTCVQCAKGADCGAGFLCVLGACKAAPACQSDAQCKTTKQVCAKAEQLCVDCVDKNDCATGQVCVATQCVAAPKACTSSKDCPSLCDKAQGVCVGCLGHDDCAKDQFCGAGNVCVKDLCSGPQCSGGTIFACKASGGGFDAPKACEDNNPCTDNACQPGPGCVFPPNAAPCSDGNACTDKDVCASGKCAGAGKVDCDDKNPCTDDGCGAQAGCTHTSNAAACDDGNPCTPTDKCAAGQCVGAGAKACDDKNPCTDNGCDKAGCKYTPNAAPCDDGKPCSVSDKCAAGQCAAGPAKACNDGNECTADACDAATGACSYTKKAGCVPASLPPCDSAADCAAGVCDLKARACVECVGAGDCAGKAVCQQQQCKPASACTSDTQCKALKQVCHGTLKVCVDCAGPSDCAADQLCVETACVAAPACKSSKDCAKVCNPQKGICVECVTSADCSGGAYCNGNAQCAVPICKTQACGKAGLYLCKSDGSGYQQAKACVDGNECSQDGCHPAQGCTFTPVEGACSATTACVGKCQAGACTADGPYLFEKAWGSSSSDEFEEIAALADGGWLLAGRYGGNASDGWLLHADAAGAKVWDKLYGSTGYDTFVAVTLAPSGGFVAAGYTTSTGAGKEDGWLVRVQPDGVAQWQKTFGAAANERLFDVVAVGDGFAAVGSTDKPSTAQATQYDAWLLRVDGAGKEVWSVLPSMAGSDALYGVAAMPDNGLVATGYTSTKNPHGDIWVMRTDAAGKMVWDKSIGASSYDAGLAVVAGSDGSIWLAGYHTKGGSLSNTQFGWLGKLTGAGEVVWTKSYETANGYASLSGLALVPGGGVIAAGKRYGYTGGGNGNDDGWAVRADAQGAKLWEDSFGTSGSERFQRSPQRRGAASRLPATSPRAAIPTGGSCARTRSATTAARSPARAPSCRRRAATTARRARPTRATSPRAASTCRSRAAASSTRSARTARRSAPRMSASAARASTTRRVRPVAAIPT